MKQLKLLLADSLSYDLDEVADVQGTTPEQVVIALLTDFLRPISVTEFESDSRESEEGRLLVVADLFPHYPAPSIDLAQRVVDYACSLPKVTAKKLGRGVAFYPRFARVEYLISFRGTPGVVVSLYGTPDQFAAPAGFLKPDRHSYSRARLHNEHDVETFLPLLRQAYERRYGRTEGGVE